MNQIDNIVSCHEYHHIKEDYTQEDFIYAKQKAIENPILADSTIPIQFNPLVSLVQFDVWMFESLKLRKNTMNKVNPEPIDYWWMNPSKFPCMLIADTSFDPLLVWVHYAAHDNAYDCRNNKYSLTANSNWRRATKQEIIDNIKGL